MKQIKPRFERLEKQMRGLAATMIALTAISMGQKNMLYGMGIIRTLFKKWRKDPDFETLVEKRMQKFGVIKY